LGGAIIPDWGASQQLALKPRSSSDCMRQDTVCARFTGGSCDTALSRLDEGRLTRTTSSRIVPPTIELLPDLLTKLFEQHVAPPAAASHPIAHYTTMLPAFSPKQSRSVRARDFEPEDPHRDSHRQRHLTTRELTTAPIDAGRSRQVHLARHGWSARWLTSVAR
jgi:hypothetical protein